jgi:hypothetical protein
LNTFRWSFQFTEEITELSEKTIVEIHETFLDGFGLESGWSHSGIRERIQKSSIVGLLYNSSGIIYGYAIYSIPSATLTSLSMLWEDAICLRRKARGLSLTSGIIETICEKFPDRSFGWFGGRTQNPVVFKRYSKIGNLYPFEIPFSSDRGKRVIDFLKANIAEVQETQDIDLDTGICRCVYKEGRLGDYPEKVKGTERYEKQLSDWNFNRDNGDAIIVIARANAEG